MEDHLITCSASCHHPFVVNELSWQQMFGVGDNENVTVQKAVSRTFMPEDEALGLTHECCDVSERLCVLGMDQRGHCGVMILDLRIQRCVSENLRPVDSHLPL